MSVAIYQVELKDLFTGPADLLLFLVRKQEVNVLDCSLAEITTRFQEYLEVLEFIDFDLAADFLVTAATLAEIKSRLALIKDEPEEEEVEEIAEQAGNSELVKHLLQYRQLKQAAETLQEQALAWHDRYPRLADERPDAKRSLADDYIKDIEVWDLVGAFSRIVRKREDGQEHKVKIDDTPIHVYVERIGNQVRAEERVLFQRLFDQEADRSKIVGMFLAVLELVRHHAFRVEQIEDFGEIWILPPVENSDKETDNQPTETEPPPED